LRVADVMSGDVEFIAADALAKDAAVLMGELDVGALPVGTPDRLEGVVTDRDLLYRVVARGLDCATVRLRDVLSQPVVFCAEEDSVQSAMDKMAANQVRRLPVLNGNGVVTGWITLADLARKLLVESEAMQGALRGLTEPA